MIKKLADKGKIVLSASQMARGDDVWLPVKVDNRRGATGVTSAMDSTLAVAPRPSHLYGQSAEIIF